MCVEPKRFLLRCRCGVVDQARVQWESLFGANGGPVSIAVRCAVLVVLRIASLCQGQWAQGRTARLHCAKRFGTAAPLRLVKGTQRTVSTQERPAKA